MLSPLIGIYGVLARYEDRHLIRSVIDVTTQASSHQIALGTRTDGLRSEATGAPVGIAMQQGGTSQYLATSYAMTVRAELSWSLSDVSAVVSFLLPPTM